MAGLIDCRTVAAGTIRSTVGGLQALRTTPLHEENGISAGLRSALTRRVIRPPSL